MTEEEARDRIAADHGAAAAARVAAFLDMVVAENTRQNLVAPSTIDRMWTRHALDSAQLVPLARDGPWLDIGTGGGFPGLVVALLRSDPMTLVEPRRKRAAFLKACVEHFALRHVNVAVGKVEAISHVAATISARAVGSIEKLLQIAGHCAKVDTRWLLPRGRLAEADLAELRAKWRGVFHVEHSLTDPSSSILVVDGIACR